MTAAVDTPRMSARPLWSPAMWLIDTHGRDELERICAALSVEPDALLDHSAWIDFSDATRFLSVVREQVDDEDQYLEACSYKMREGYGPVLLVLPAATPQLLFRTIARTVPLFSNVSRCEVTHESRTRAVLRYSTDAPEVETRELCLTRVAAMTGIPTMFGLPPALITEKSCVANGDAACEYHCRFYTRNRWVPTALGVLAGAGAAYALSTTGLDPVMGLWTLPVLLGLIGNVWELRRTTSANRALAEDIQAALRDLAEAEGEARREIVAFHQRQKEWGKLMEEQVAERTEQLRDLIARIQSMSEARVSTVRGVSHDLRNPVTIVRLNHELLRQRLPDDERMYEALSDSEEALAQMEKMLVDLTQSAASDGGLVPIKPVEMEIAPWVDVLRRRVKALAYGKDISVSVFRRREAPEHIETDRLVFERVVDNICSNAAKYTERGSIVVELDGKPGFLTLKVSDTGVGIEPERIAQIFEPGQTSDRDRAPRSLGVGLSVVVQLLAQIGGKLEVMSKPEQGTTFWAHFPIELPKPEQEPVVTSRHTKLAEVVTIRRALSA